MTFYINSILDVKTLPPTHKALTVSNILRPSKNRWKVIACQILRIIIAPCIFLVKLSDFPWIHNLILLTSKDNLRVEFHEKNAFAFPPCAFTSVNVKICPGEGKLSWHFKCCSSKLSSQHRVLGTAESLQGNNDRFSKTKSSQSSSFQSCRTSCL